MREVNVTMYEANDGKLFDTKENCLAYESKEILRIMKDCCDKAKDCEGCLFYGSGCMLSGIPSHWVIE
jgi:hypothetical protein